MTGTTSTSDEPAGVDVVEFNRSPLGIAWLLGLMALLLLALLLGSCLTPLRVPILYSAGAGLLIGVVPAVSAVRGARTRSWMEVGPQGLAYVAGKERAEFPWAEVARVGPTTARAPGVGPTTLVFLELGEAIRAGPTRGQGLAGLGTATALVIEPVRRAWPGTRRRRQRGPLTYSFKMRGYPVMYVGMNAEKWYDVGVAVHRHAPGKWSSADRVQ